MLSEMKHHFQELIRDQRVMAQCDPNRKAKLQALLASDAVEHRHCLRDVGPTTCPTGIAACQTSSNAFRHETRPRPEAFTGPDSRGQVRRKPNAVDDQRGGQGISRELVGQSYRCIAQPASWDGNGRRCLAQTSHIRRSDLTFLKDRSGSHPGATQLQPILSLAHISLLRWNRGG
nr:hypothetical protein CFP56_09032 [Quercus suber]